MLLKETVVLLSRHVKQQPDNRLPVLKQLLQPVTADLGSDVTLTGHAALPDGGMRETAQYDMIDSKCDTIVHQ